MKESSTKTWHKEKELSRTPMGISSQESFDKERNTAMEFTSSKMAPFTKDSSRTTKRAAMGF